MSESRWPSSNRAVISVSDCDGIPPSPYLVTHNHRQTVRHGDQVCPPVVRSWLKVARGRARGRGTPARGTMLIVLEAELPRILADHLDVGPAKSGEPLPRHLA